MILSLIVAALLSADAQGPGGPVPSSGSEGLFKLLPVNPMEGSRLFTQKGCLGCHAIQGVGGGRGPDLGRILMNRTLLDIAGEMWNHFPRMEQAFRERHQARPQFDEAEMASVLSFLYYLGSFEKPGEPAAGERLFRGTCAKCHAVGGVGGTVGPVLDGYSHYASPHYLTSGMWNHGPRMSAAMKKEGISRPTFDGKQIADLVAYLRSQSTSVDREYAQPGNPRRGEELFKGKHCAECHLLDGRKGVGPNLSVTVRGSLTQISGILWNHAPAMWPKMAERGIEVPKLSPTDTGDLVTYLYFLQFIAPAGDPERGRIVFREAQCKSCHAGLANSPPKAPNLIGGTDGLRSGLKVVVEMWNHGGKMEEAMTEANLVWPTLKRGEMADLVAFLSSARGGESAPAP